MCVLSTLQAAPNGHQSDSSAELVTIKGNENETVKTAKSLTAGSRTKKSNLKSTPITYITTLADAGHQHHVKPAPKKYNKPMAKARDDKELQQHKKGKVNHHHSEKSTGKSLEVKPKKEFLNNPALLR